MRYTHAMQRLFSIFSSIILAAVVAYAQIPAAPTHMYVSNIDAHTVRITWADEATNETAYYIYSNQVNSFPVGFGIHASSNTTSCSISNLTYNTIYYYWVQASNDSGSASTMISKHLLIPPAAPTNMTVLSAGYEDITLQWYDASTNETLFRLFISTSNVLSNATDVVSVLGSTNTLSNAMSHTLMNLISDTDYYIWVRAENDGGTGCAGPLLAHTLPPIPPTAPLHLTATNFTFWSFTLQWSNTATNADAIIIYTNSTDDFTTAITQSTLSASATEITLDVFSGKTYFIWVQATNRGGSGTNSMSTNAPLPPLPSAPTNCSNYTITPISAAITWSNTATNASMILIYSNTVNSFATAAVFGTFNSNTATTIVSNLQPDSDYWFWIQSSNVAGSGLSASAFMHTLPIPPPPAAPTNCTHYSVTPISVSIAWSNAATNASMIIVYSNAASNFTAAGIFGIFTSHTTSVVLTNLQPDTDYWFWVQSSNFGGSGLSESVFVHILPIPPPPSAPRDLTIDSIYTGSALLYFTDTASNETGFIIYLGQSTNHASAAIIRTLPASLNTGITIGPEVIRSLKSDTVYYIWVQASNLGGSAYSQPVQFRTLHHWTTAADLSEVTIGPNPFKPHESGILLTFYNLTPYADITLYNYHGEKIAACIKPDDGQSKFIWDMTGIMDTLAPGIYIIKVINPDTQEIHLLRFAIVR